MNVNYLKPNENNEFKSMFYLNGFIQFITKPTHISKGSQILIDIIATNCVEIIAR